MSYPSSPPVPEEFRVLSMMNNVGAVTPERSLTIEEIAMWTGFVETAIRDHLKRLMEQGYVEQVQVQGVKKYHVTKMGIIKVLSMYS